MLKKGLVALALFGFLFQTLIPLAQTIPHTNSGKNLAGLLVICTAFGTKTIDIATGAEIPDDEDIPEDSTESVICLAKTIVINTLITVRTAERLQSPVRFIKPPLSSLNTFHSPHLTDAHGARAPPAA